MTKSTYRESRAVKMLVIRFRAVVVTNICVIPLCHFLCPNRYWLKNRVKSHLLIYLKPLTRAQPKVNTPLQPTLLV